jgi:hypothetical protein
LRITLSLAGRPTSTPLTVPPRSMPALRVGCVLAGRRSGAAMGSAGDGAGIAAATPGEEVPTGGLPQAEKGSEAAVSARRRPARDLRRAPCARHVQRASRRRRCRARPGVGRRWSSDAGPGRRAELDLGLRRRRRTLVRLCKRLFRCAPYPQMSSVRVLAWLLRGACLGVGRCSPSDRSRRYRASGRRCKVLGQGSQRLNVSGSAWLVSERAASCATAARSRVRRA